MKKIILLIVIIGFISCKEEKETAESIQKETIIELNKVNWNKKETDDYLYRELLIDSVIENKELRSLGQNELINVLGEPNRMENNHLYYTISQKKLGFWPLHTKTLVIKYSESDTITWIKIHE
jgi:PBP1b-binding outer membrane lipoprotein LpoB